LVNIDSKGGFKLKNLICKKELEELNSIKGENERFRSQNNQLRLEIEEYEKIIEEIIEITKNNNVQILSVEYIEKFGGRVIVYKEKDSYDIYVKSAYSSSFIKFLPHDIKINVRYNEDKHSLFIEDIQTGSYTNKGLGSAAMEALIKYARENKITYISGSISPTDWDHIERLEHFYKKHGFDVKLNEQSESGSIRLDLN
jgi:GNAT superfamily N-acetyltransferase